VSITDQLLAALLVYGLWLLFAVIAIASVGVPLPVTLMLVVAGSFVEQGEMTLWQVMAVASGAAVLGDQIGYGLARWRGRNVVLPVVSRFSESSIAKAEDFARRWGGAGIFFSRWLVTWLGPWLNVTSGMARYPWRRFLFWDILGQMIWVGLYVMLGKIFSDRVQELMDLLGNLGWVNLGLFVAAVLGWKTVQYLRSQKSAPAR
jgi:membrane protein DedA with SNARE-associated domain